MDAIPRIRSNREPESERGRQIAMKSVARGVVGAVIVAAALSGCGSSPPSTGVLTGRVAACTLFAARHPTTVTVYAREHLVATQRLPGAGTAFRFSLPAGRYLLKDATGSYPVVVSKGGTRHVPEFACG
jgi:hypothetical protein